jgi:transcriptional regulator CtsR
VLQEATPGGPGGEGGLDQEQAVSLVGALRQVGLLTAREEALLSVLFDRQVLLISLPERDRLRARMLQAALRALAVGTVPSPSTRREPHGV